MRRLISKLWRRSQQPYKLAETLELRLWSTIPRPFSSPIKRMKLKSSSTLIGTWIRWSYTFHKTTTSESFSRRGGAVMEDDAKNIAIMKFSVWDTVDDCMNNKTTLILLESVLSSRRTPKGTTRIWKSRLEKDLIWWGCHTIVFLVVDTS